jgi:hypothetical protein
MFAPQSKLRSRALFWTSSEFWITVGVAQPGVRLVVERGPVVLRVALVLDAVRGDVVEPVREVVAVEPDVVDDQPVRAPVAAVEIDGAGVGARARRSRRCRRCSA